MLFASLVRLLRPSTRKPAPAEPEAVIEDALTEPRTAPAQIVPLVTRSMHELTAQRPTITVWIGDTSYQAMVV